MTRLARLAPALLLGLGLSGCGLIYKVDVQQGNLLDKRLVEQLKPGMSKRQVALALGTPSVTSPFAQSRWDYVSSIKRRGKDMETRTLTLTFDGDALARIEGDYFPEDSAQLIKDAKKYRVEFPDEKRPDEKKKNQG
jgi:outer membrane protein assembly factor BamE